MRIIGQSRQRKVFAFKEVVGDVGGLKIFEYYLSPDETAKNGRRPIARFSTESELMAAVADRNCQVIWQTS